MRCRLESDDPDRRRIAIVLAVIGGLVAVPTTFCILFPGDYLMAGGYTDGQPDWRASAWSAWSLSGSGIPFGLMLPPMGYLLFMRHAGLWRAVWSQWLGTLVAGVFGGLAGPVAACLAACVGCWLGAGLAAQDQDG